MQVVIIGTGNVASVFARLIAAKGHTIAEVYGRNIMAAEAIAATVKARAVADLSGLTQNADIYIITVADKAVAEIAAQLSLPSALVLHTTASLSKHILKGVSERYGVLYPLQSLRKQMDSDTVVPFLIDGNTEPVTKEIEQFASGLSGKVIRAGDETRVKLHVAAVFACNFVNYMYVQSAAFCTHEGLDFSLLQPLIEETALRLRDNQPGQVFTGPAVRGDVATMERHLSLLEAYPELADMYRTLSNKIMKAYSK